MLGALLLWAAMVAFLVGVLVKAIVDREYLFWAPRLAEALIRLAALLLPRDERAVRRDEWLAEREIIQLRYSHAGVLFAIGLVCGAVKRRAEVGHREAMTLVRRHATKAALEMWGDRFARLATVVAFAVAVPTGIAFLVVAFVGSEADSMLATDLFLILGLSGTSAWALNRIQRDPSERSRPSQDP